MRTLLLAALFGGALTSAQAKPPGYHSPRKLHTVKSQQGFRQLPLRITLGGNTAYYNGDITTRFQDNTYRPGVEFGVVKPITPRVTIGLEATYFQLKAKDSDPNRGLRFTSDNFMLVPFLRVNLLADKSMYLGTSYQPQQFQVYVEVGVGALRYNPKAYQASNGPLPLITESKAAYPATAGVAPVGLGMTYKASPGVFVSLEALYYFSSTDLLDDISERGNSKSLDGFATANLKVEFALPHKHGKPLVHFD